MEKRSWKTYVIWIAVTEAVGALSALLTRSGMERYNEFATKPPLSPPGVVFPIVWVILYALMGVSAALVYENGRGEDRTIGLSLYLGQLFFNFLWSIIFFDFGAYLIALIWIVALWVLILLMMIYFFRVSRTAAYLQIPYILWVGFATYLTAATWVLNK